MSTDQLTVIATRLPYVDRRALSQAWFSALHLAGDGATTTARGRHVDDLFAHAFGPRQRVVTRGGGRGIGPATPMTFRGSTRSTPISGLAAARVDANRPSKPVAHHNASDPTGTSYPAFRTSLTIGVAGERVTLVLRREGPTLHVVALCRAERADAVRAALARADAHLRARGQAIHAVVETAASGGTAR